MTTKTAVKSAKKIAVKSARKTVRKSIVSSPKAATKKPLKDPQGGLTAAGRATFRRTTGSQLKPGVKKSSRDMTLHEMKRKGSWASRFYGRAKLPALIDHHGRPTRFALSAHAWGEPVPKTLAQARAIAARGLTLLQRYHREMSG